MRLEAQIGVVGAGPAGARAAERLADLGADVVLLDPKAPWEKPCGGGLTAAALENVPDLAAVLPKARRITSVRLEAAHSVVNVPLERTLYVLSRTALGLWQLDRARAAGASFEPAAVRRIERVAGRGWRLETGDGRNIHVRLLVGADGAASRVRKTVAPELDIELAPARVAYAPAAGAMSRAIGLRLFPMAAGYARDFPRPDLGRCGCVYADRAGAVIGTAARPTGGSTLFSGAATMRSWATRPDSPTRPLEKASRTRSAPRTSWPSRSRGRARLHPTRGPRGPAWSVNSRWQGVSAPSSTVAAWPPAASSARRPGAGPTPCWPPS